MSTVYRQRPYAYQETVSQGALAPAFPQVRVVRVLSVVKTAKDLQIPGVQITPEPSVKGFHGWSLQGPDSAFEQLLSEQQDLPKGWLDAIRDALYPPRQRWVDGQSRDLLEDEGSLIMGILNITPDSFSDGGLYLDPEKAVNQALALQQEGAQIIDIGGESTRPGADAVSSEEELARVLPVLEALRNLPPGKFRLPISIDTRNPEVASQALNAGACILNDVQGLRLDAMVEVAKETRCAVVLMHMRGEPGDMNQLARYDHVVDEVVMELLGARDRAVQAGIKSEQILLDPGVGFAKTGGQSWQLLQHLPAFLPAGHGLMVGASRKRLLEELLSLPVSQRDRASAFLHAWSVARGAKVLRVHDPAALLEAVTVAQAMGFGLPS